MYNLLPIKVARYVCSSLIHSMGFPDGSAGKESACNAGGEYMGAYHTSTRFFSMFKVFFFLRFKKEKSCSFSSAVLCPGHIRICLWVCCRGQEDSLEKEMATQFSILAWRIQRSPAGYSPWGCKESDMTKRLPLFIVYLCGYAAISKTH